MAAFKRHLKKSQLEPATVDTETSQLRSLARQAEQRSALTLRDLRDRPKEAIPLIEQAGTNRHNTTVQARIRAFQRFLMMGVSPDLGKESSKGIQGSPSEEGAKGLA